MTERDQPGQWLALHIFYAANPRPMVAECLRPLLRRLTDAELLSRYFFLNYWMEGPHVRLRLKPRRASDESVVREIAESAVGEYLARRPALYAMDSGYREDLQEMLFRMEYPEGDPEHLLDADGHPKMQPNNTFEYRPYEPEYGKYGGPAGVELAEWHFRHSTDLVMDLVDRTNLHHRPVALGIAAQLMVVMTSTFLPARAGLLEFLDSYHRFAHNFFAATDYADNVDYEVMYDRMAPQLARRFEPILDALEAGRPGRLPQFLQLWADHSADLRSRVVALAEAGDLAFAYPEGSPPETVTDPDLALPRLLLSYLHMTNNRMYMTLRDEAYLSYLVGRSLRAEPVAP